MFAVAIDDHAGQSVALAPNHAAQFWIDISTVTVLGGLRDAAFEKIKIEILPLPRKATRDNLRLGIVNRTADQTIAPVFQRNHVAIRRISENLQHLAGKNPVVAVQDVRAGFDNKAGHVFARDW